MNFKEFVKLKEGWNYSGPSAINMPPGGKTGGLPYALQRLLHTAPYTKDVAYRIGNRTVPSWAMGFRKAMTNLWGGYVNATMQTIGVAQATPLILPGAPGSTTKALFGEVSPKHGIRMHVKLTAKDLADSEKFNTNPIIEKINELRLQIRGLKNKRDRTEGEQQIYAMNRYLDWKDIDIPALIPMGDGAEFDIFVPYKPREDVTQVKSKGNYGAF